MDKNNKVTESGRMEHVKYDKKFTEGVSIHINCQACEALRTVGSRKWSRFTLLRGKESNCFTVLFWISGGGGAGAGRDVCPEKQASSGARKAKEQLQPNRWVCSLISSRKI
ncbi:hypothetical protein Q8A67_009277 [Cirrhinus molitorella]|uniref:Uncharacterized protein n=1 Tax=Cirrhinus molitorella TaxID=172907 RepID=A0AA88TZX3_9TELE|nr:hypothetical protein Q8A67_009277 [Cirrhinus molitorella]